MYPFLSAPSPIKKTWLTWLFSWLTWFEITKSGLGADSEGWIGNLSLNL